MIKINKNNLLIIIAIVGIIITGALIFGKNSGQFSFLNLGFSNDKIAQKSLDYINNNLLQGQAPATLTSTSEESGLVKMKIKIGSTEYDTYATKDGKLLFPEAFKLETNNENANQQATQNNQPTEEEIAKAASSIKKTDAPLVEAYVVSRCPYGLQMQRVMADAIKNIPSMAQYMKVRYIGAVSGGTITAMHGETEAKENLRQICIREEQASKYWDYVSCQMKSGDTAGCEKSTGVDSAKLNACASDGARGVAYAQKDFNLASKNSIQGSPTLVLGDAKISEYSFGGRSSEALKKIICSAFNSAPGFCSTKLNTAEAAVSFSNEYAGSGGSGNSGANGTNCAPAQ